MPIVLVKQVLGEKVANYKKWWVEALLHFRTHIHLNFSRSDLLYYILDYRRIIKKLPVYGLYVLLYCNNYKIFLRNKKT